MKRTVGVVPMLRDASGGAIEQEWVWVDCAVDNSYMVEVNMECRGLAKFQWL